MNPAEFQPNTPGRIVPIPGNDHAFVPDPLPPAWQFPERLWPLLNEASTKLGLLEGVGRHLPAADLLLRPLERREAVQSSAIEGTFATPRELLLFEIEPSEPVREDDPANSWKEVFNSQQALQYGTSSELPRRYDSFATCIGSCSPACADTNARQVNSVESKWPSVRPMNVALSHPQFPISPHALMCSRNI